MTRLGKAHVEALLAAYDSDPIAALTTALRITLEEPTLVWAELLAVADISDQRRRLLLRHEPGARDELVAELNEVRSMGRRTPQSHPQTSPARSTYRTAN